MREEGGGRRGDILGYNINPLSYNNFYVKLCVCRGRKKSPEEILVHPL